MTSALVDRTLSLCEEMQADLEAKGGKGWSKGLAEARWVAGVVAHQFVNDGTAYADVQPGNGTAYQMVLQDLGRAQAVASAMIFQDSEPFSHWRKYLDLHQGPASRWGGRLMVSLPELSGGGRCQAMAIVELYHPVFVHEHFNLSLGDAVPLAIWLSLFGAHVLEIEDALP